MKQKKNKGLLITIIVLLVVILLLVGVMAYLYIFTDILKSNKQLFFKYTSQIVQNEDGFINNQLMEYFKKKKSTNYENSGNISFNITIPNLEKKLELTNNLNISFSGKVDANNMKQEREISVNYSDNVKFPLTYRKTSDMTGIQTKYIGSNFVAVRNDEELSGSGELNRLLEFKNIEFSNEEIQNLKTTYFDNILNNLDDGKFSKITDGDLTGYKLTLSGEEFKNILVQILDLLKTDENTINKINEILNGLGTSSELDVEKLETIIQNINDLEINNNIEFAVYEKEGILTRIDIGSIMINREENEQEVSYTVSTNGEKESKKVSFRVTYIGLNSNTIKENYELVIEETSNNASIISEVQKSQQNTQVSQEEETLKLLISEIVTDKVANGEDYTQIFDTDIEQKLSSGDDDTYSDIKVEKQSDTEYRITFISTGDEFVIDNTGSIIEEPEIIDTNENTNSDSQNTTMHYQYTITNDVEFKDNVDIEDLTSENAVILNDQDEAYVTNLMSAIEQRLIEVNKTQMEELGVSENENPIQYIIPSFLSIIFLNLYL